MALSSKNPTKLRQVELDEDESRFVADIPKRLHKLIRVKCAELEVDQKTFFLDMLAAQHGIK
jgi:hypothetical protein